MTSGDEPGLPDGLPPPPDGLPPCLPGGLPPCLYVADDNADLAQLIGRVAERAGWQATLCGEGRALVDRLAADPRPVPALLIVDINMPGMDGFATLEHLAGLDRRFRLRFMTGGSDVDTVAAGLKARARGLDVGGGLLKPIHLGLLRRVLAQEAELLAQMAAAGTGPDPAD